MRDEAEAAAKAGDMDKAARRFRSAAENHPGGAEHPEAKALLAHPAFRAEIDPAEIDELLAFRYVAGERSLLKGVRHVEPGTYLTITSDGLTRSRYWSLSEERDTLCLSRDDAVERLEGVLSGSVRSQLQSDVPVGCQLSGGVDSSLVTMFAGRHHAGDVMLFRLLFRLPHLGELPVDPLGEILDGIAADAELDEMKGHGRTFGGFRREVKS